MKLKDFIDCMITTEETLTIRYWDNYHFVENDFTADEAMEKFADALVLSFYAKAEHNIWIRVCN